MTISSPSLTDPPVTGCEGRGQEDVLQRTGHAETERENQVQTTVVHWEQCNIARCGQ